jgi:hypothetical protein
MKTKTPLQPANQIMETELSWNVDEVSPHSSAIVGVTLLGDLEDALAALRTAVLLARSLRAPLTLSLPEKDVLPVDFDETPSSTLVSRLLDSARAQLGRLAAPAFVMEVNLVAASFVRGGSITMRVRSANPVLGVGKLGQARSRARTI